ncbi:RalBP1-associated Eps domain-containing protein 2 [Willisornis vidua]|uniref:RalBP1-associated Eps domain-containing protein 2 n=1 Tax=Willisornis vidua TaxID=1566151 RepID=A0ABQ9CUC2_9PASS|nr:RalBP1-associated Eps domain-containing protein 2 [Willisornis vidua]
MEQGPAGASAAAAAAGTGGLLLPLSETEQQRYSELFSRCCPPPEAAAGGSSVGELFRASQLPPDTLHQTNSAITDSSDSDQAPFSEGRRPRFPVTLSDVSPFSGDSDEQVDYPWHNKQITEVCGAKRVGYFGPAQFYIALKLIAAAQSGFPVRIESIKNELPLPRFMALKNDTDIRYGTPAELHGVKFQIPHSTLEKNSYKRTDEGDKQEPNSPPMSPICSPPASPSTYQRIPVSYGYGKARSGLEQQHGVSVAPYEVRHSTHQQDGPSSGNYGAKSALNCSTPNRCPACGRCQCPSFQSLSVEREQQDSSTHYSDDPWRITEEQRDYYINQFRSLQPDLNAFISGSVAKNFFTKSKLPIPELSHIWELSDVDCDGALTLPEFCAAFHLVVARKNGYQLPETLPETLLPEYLQAASLKPMRDCALFDSYSEPLPGSQQTRDFSRTEKSSTEEVPDNSALLQDGKKDDKQALKVSTTLKTIPKEFQHLTVKTAAQESNALRARPRSRSYSSTSIEDAMKKGEEPPTPPPRPQKSHSRASSLDLNKIFQQNTQGLRSGWLPPPPPALPPRPSVSQTEQPSEVDLHPQMNRPSSQAEENSSAKKEVVLTQPPSKPARRKLRTEAQGLDTPEASPTINVTSSLPTAKAHLPVQKQSSKQKRAIQTAIRKNKEANAVLARLNSELQQQLKEVHKERIALETQLEQLRPVTVLTSTRTSLTFRDEQEWSSNSVSSSVTTNGMQSLARRKEEKEALCQLCSEGSLKAGDGLGLPLMEDHLVFSWDDISMFQLKSSDLGVSTVDGLSAREEIG